MREPALGRAEFDPAAGDLYRSLKLWDKAASSYTRSGRHVEAAECHRKVGAQGKAADAYARAGDLEKAMRYYVLARNYDKEIDCLEKLGRWDTLAKRRLLGRDAENAIRYYSRWLKDDSGERQAALRAEAEALAPKKAFDAAARFSALGDHARAGDLFKKQFKWDEALAENLADGDHLGASDCYWRLTRYTAAAKERELAGRHDAQTVNLHLRAVDGTNFRPDQKKVEALEIEAESFEAKGDYQRALSRYMAIGNVDAAMPLFKRVTRDDEAFSFLAKYSAFAELDSLIQEKRKFRLSHDFIMAQKIEFEFDTYGQEASRVGLAILGLLAREHSTTNYDNAHLRDEVDAILPFGNDLIYVDIAAENRVDLVDFLLRAGHFNALYLIAHSSRSFGAPRYAFAVDLIRKVADKAGSEGRGRAWYACLFAAIEGGKLAAPPPKEELDPWNTIPYFLGTEEPFTVLDWYFETGREAEIEGFVGLLGIHGFAAKYFELRGDFKRAAPLYSKAKRWSEALLAYRSIGDEAGMAKASEKLGDLASALAIFKKLGKAKDALRVEKALAAGKAKKAEGEAMKAEGEANQLSLF